MSTDLVGPSEHICVGCEDRLENTVAVEVELIINELNIVILCGNDVLKGTAIVAKLEVHVGSRGFEPLNLEVVDVGVLVLITKEEVHQLVRLLRVTSTVSISHALGVEVAVGKVHLTSVVHPEESSGKITAVLEDTRLEDEEIDGRWGVNDRLVDSSESLGVVLEVVILVSNKVESPQECFGLLGVGLSRGVESEVRTKVVDGDFHGFHDDRLLVRIVVQSSEIAEERWNTASERNANILGNGGAESFARQKVEWETFDGEAFGVLLGEVLVHLNKLLNLLRGVRRSLGGGEALEFLKEHVVLVALGVASKEPFNVLGTLFEASEMSEKTNTAVDVRDSVLDNILDAV